jgi:hypothetical protein
MTCHFQNVNNLPWSLIYCHIYKSAAHKSISKCEFVPWSGKCTEADLNARRRMEGKVPSTKENLRFSWHQVWRLSSGLLHYVVLLMEAARTCETSVNFYQIMQHNTEDCHLHTCNYIFWTVTTALQLNADLPWNENSWTSDLSLHLVTIREIPTSLTKY